MREIANFLWIGEALYPYEAMCLRSFIRHGFDVRVWSYTTLALPAGATRMDARRILPEAIQNQFNQGGKLNNFAAFSDVFRFTLLATRTGEWWFDTDCVCLKDQSAFQTLKVNKRIVVGREDGKRINGAVLCFLDAELGNYLLQEQARVIQSRSDFEWGAIGPILITECLERRNLVDEAFYPKFFYPISWPKAALLNDPWHGNLFKKVTEDSYVCHLWNEKLSEYVDKRLEPNKNSYLDFLFRTYA